MEIVIARVRLLEILVESPLRVNAARLPPRGLHRPATTFDRIDEQNDLWLASWQCCSQKLPIPQSRPHLDFAKGDSSGGSRLQPSSSHTLARPSTLHHFSIDRTICPFYYL